MRVNLDKPHLWKEDVAQSVDLYNTWFMKFAPVTYQETRVVVTKQVEEALTQTKNLTDIGPSSLRKNPGAVLMLRSATAPPIARDRLIGLAKVSQNLVHCMEAGELPKRASNLDIECSLQRIGDIIRKLADPDIFHWLKSNSEPSPADIHRAATIVADRLCGATTDPIIRNAQEQRQLALMEDWLCERGYKRLPDRSGVHIRSIPPGTYSFRFNVPIQQEGAARTINIPIDAVIMPKDAKAGVWPLLVEAKSAGDFTNPNKRRKEEATKMAQLRATYGNGIRFILFLCGYFDSGYLGYEAAEGIDWVWEHRIEDLALFGI